MEISKPNNLYLDTDKLRLDLEYFLNQPGPGKVPPCPNCKDHCASKCNVSCPDIATVMSIDPVKYPIETNIVPLVFGVMSTSVLQTCWSCEGHLNEKNELWKMPNVSFYSQSSIYPHLILRHLKNLKLDKALKYSWHVVLDDFAQTLGITYSIQPDLKHDEDIHLGMLQNDIKILSTNMLDNMKNIARKLLQEITNKH